MSVWEKFNGDLQSLRVGDIVEMSSKVPSNNRFFPDLVVTFVKHYGVVVEQNGKLMIAHNPYGGVPEIVSFDKIFTNRLPDRVMHTNATNEQIIERMNSCAIDKRQTCKNASYKFWHFNCEDFVCYVCQCNIGADQRVVYFGGGATVIMLTVISVVTYLIVKK